MSNKLRFAIIGSIIAASMFVGALVAAAFSGLTEREKDFIRYGEITQAMNQLHDENERDRKVIEDRGFKWKELDAEKNTLEQKLFQ